MPCLNGGACLLNTIIAFYKGGNIYLLKEYPDVLNFEQFRNSLGLGKNKAYELLHNKEIQHFKIGSYYKIPKMAVVNYINKQVQNA